MRLSKLVPVIGVAGAVTGGTLAAPRLVTDLLWRRKTRSSVQRAHHRPRSKPLVARMVPGGDRRR